MARYNDSSVHRYKWTNRKLISELRRIANFEKASCNLPEGYVSKGWVAGDQEAINEATRLYRQSYLEPLIAEIEKRFVR